MNEHERAFVVSFMLPKRKERYLGFLSSHKHRSKFIGRMAHKLLDDLDERYVREQEKLSKTEAERIQHLIYAADESGRVCYVVSEQPELDGKEMSFDQAQSGWDQSSAIIISVIPGKLAFYRPERPSEDYVLLRE
jgi:hypothetical protein